MPIWGIAVIAGIEKNLTIQVAQKSFGNLLLDKGGKP
jgi:hypothetical protein